MSFDGCIARPGECNLRPSRRSIDPRQMQVRRERRRRESHAVIPVHIRRPVSRERHRGLQNEPAQAKKTAAMSTVHLINSIRRSVSICLLAKRSGCRKTINTLGLDRLCSAASSSQVRVDCTVTWPGLPSSQEIVHEKLRLQANHLTASEQTVCHNAPRETHLATIIHSGACNGKPSVPQDTWLRRGCECDTNETCERIHVIADRNSKFDFRLSLALIQSNTSHLD